MKNRFYNSLTDTIITGQIEGYNLVPFGQKTLEYCKSADRTFDLAFKHD